jgi:hypothetical protein
MNPKVIEAASVYRIDNPHAEERARRVLHAQAECVSDGMVEAFISSYERTPIDHHRFERIRAAISAALRFEAGE